MSQSIPVHPSNPSHRRSPLQSANSKSFFRGDLNQDAFEIPTLWHVFERGWRNNPNGPCLGTLPRLQAPTFSSVSPASSSTPSSPLRSFFANPSSSSATSGSTTTATTQPGSKVVYKSYSNVRNLVLKLGIGIIANNELDSVKVAHEGDQRIRKVGRKRSKRVKKYEHDDDDDERYEWTTTEDEDEERVEEQQEGEEEDPQISTTRMNKAKGNGSSAISSPSEGTPSFNTRVRGRKDKTKEKVRDWQNNVEGGVRTQNTSGRMKYGPGLKKGDRVAVWMENREEWTISSLALHRFSLPLIGLYASSQTPTPHQLNETLSIIYRTRPKLLVLDLPKFKSLMEFLKEKETQGSNISSTSSGGTPNWGQTNFNFDNEGKPLSESGSNVREPRSEYDVFDLCYIVVCSSPGEGVVPSSSSQTHKTKTDLTSFGEISSTSPTNTSSSSSSSDSRSMSMSSLISTGYQIPDQYRTLSKGIWFWEDILKIGEKRIGKFGIRQFDHDIDVQTKMGNKGKGKEREEMEVFAGEFRQDKARLAREIVGKRIGTRVVGVNRQQRGQGEEDPFPLPRKEDIAAILLTSGTSDVQRPTIMTHSNLVSSIIALYAKYQSGGLIEPGKEIIHLSHLPPAHIYERLAQYFVLLLSGSIAFGSGDSNRLIDDIGEVAPSMLCSVPGLLVKLANKIVESQESVRGPIERYLWKAALSQKKTFLQEGLGEKSQLWDRWVFSRSRSLLGGRLSFVLCASSPLPPGSDTLDILRIVLSVKAIEAYGLTEAGGLVAMGNSEDVEVGQVGGPVAGCEIKLIDVPGLYRAVDRPRPRGEICVKGRNVAYGYLDETGENAIPILDAEGWLHTGDCGEWDECGRLRIIDRLGQTFKLANSIDWFVCPPRVESHLLDLLPELNRLFIHGSPDHPNLVAIGLVNLSLFRKWIEDDRREREKLETPRSNSDLDESRKKRISRNMLIEGLEDGGLAEVEKLCQDPVVSKRFCNMLTILGLDAGFQPYELPKEIYLTVEEQQPQDMTPTMKFKRARFLRRWKKEIQAMHTMLEKT